MRRLLLLASVLLLSAGVALAQRGATTPPSDYDIGNSTLSPNSDVDNNPSFSPDQNQAITNDRGTATGDRYPNPAFAGSSGQKTASTAQAQGDVGGTGTTAATSGRQLPSGTKAANSKTAAARNGANSRRAGARARRSKRTGQKNTANQAVTSPVYPTGGPSTTEAPGPATGVRGKKIPQGGNGNYSGTSTKSSGPGYAGPGGTPPK